MRYIAIIGAGPAGLAAAKAVLQEGLIPIIFEASARIGGVWAPENDFSIHASAWSDMTVNISRHSGVFRDFPWPEGTPDFPKTPQVYQYLLDYAQHFDLLKYIHFNSRVDKLSLQNDKWNIEVNHDTKQADAVIVACGRHNIPAIPEFNGIKHFNGTITHSMEYKSAAHYTGKKVLVLGGSYSGTAIAEDIAKKAAVVYHVFSKPRWVITHSRAHESGAVLPRDLIQTYEQSLKTKSKEERFQFLSTLCAEQMRIPEWRMSPDGEQGVAIAEDYFALTKANKIIPKKDRIDYFTSSGVTLKSDNQLNVDEVICCTGYGYNSEFLPVDLQSLILYEDIFAPDYPTIAFAGAWIGSRGAVFPLVELQAEWICGVFSKRLQLPSPEEMRKTAHTPQERSGAEYFDAIAKTIGIYPDVEKFSPAVQELLMQSANIPARYLLVGPFSNFELAVKLLSDAKNYRDELINSSRQEAEPTPTLRPR